MPARARFSCLPCRRPCSPRRAHGPELRYSRGPRPALWRDSVLLSMTNQVTDRAATLANVSQITHRSVQVALFEDRGDALFPTSSCRGERSAVTISFRVHTVQVSSDELMYCKSIHRHENQKYSRFWTKGHEAHPWYIIHHKHTRTRAKKSSNKKVS